MFVSIDSEIQQEKLKWLLVITIGHDIVQFRPVIYIPNIGQKSVKTTQIYNNSVKNLLCLHPTGLKKGPVNNLSSWHATQDQLTTFFFIPNNILILLALLLILLNSWNLFYY